MKYRFLIGITLSILILNAMQVLGAQPTVTINPPHPTPQSTVTFTVDTSEENLLGVWLEIQECNGDKGICYTKQNLSMEETSPGSYQLSVTLQHSDATYIQYTIKLDTPNGWQEYFKETKVTLSKENNAPSDNKNNTPGFEIIGLLAASFIIIMLLRRQR